MASATDDNKTALQFINELTVLGDKLFLNTNYQAAYHCYQQALDMRSRTLGKSHTSLSIDLYNLATVSEANEQYDQAEKLYLKALNLFNRGNQPNKEKLNEFQGYLAAIRYAKMTESNLDKLQLISKAFKQLHDPDNIRIAAINHKRANNLLKKKLTSESEKAFKKAIFISQQKIGNNHPYFAKILSDYAVLMQLTARKTQAETLLKQARQILDHYPKKRYTSLYQIEQQSN